MKNVKILDDHPFTAYNKETYNALEMIQRSKKFYEWMNPRRTCRGFLNKEVPREV